MEYLGTGFDYTVTVSALSLASFFERTTAGNQLQTLAPV